MRVTATHIEWEPDHCRQCFGDGTRFVVHPCATCKGTGNGPRGGPRGCKRCHGSGKSYGPEVETCSRCNGNGVDPCRLENPYDSMPQGMWDALSIPVRVVRQERQGSWNEAHLGLGCLYSVTDYGVAGAMTNDELIATVSEHLRDRGVQLVHLVTDDTVLKIRTVGDDGEWVYPPLPRSALARWVGVFVHRNGYSVRAVATDAPAEVVAPPADLGRRLGMLVYSAGGNGTMAAAMLDQVREADR